LLSCLGKHPWVGTLFEFHFYSFNFKMHIYSYNFLPILARRTRVLPANPTINFRTADTLSKNLFATHDNQSLPTSHISNTNTEVFCYGIYLYLTEKNKFFREVKKNTVAAHKLINLVSHTRNRRRNNYLSVIIP